MDENLGVLEQRAASNAIRYGRIAAIVVGVAAVAGAGWLIYRRINRPTRMERLQSLLIEALRDLPEALRELPDEVATRLTKPMPSIKVVVNGKDEAKDPGMLESIVRRVAPAVAGTASSALMGRFTPSSKTSGDTRPSIPADD
ncbi:MAG: hypothetical protein ACYDA0_00570 [Candidatus Dormibacteraceae bacterium]